MRVKEKARRSGSYGRAKRPMHKSDADIVRDYELGCKGAAVALALAFGPMWCIGAWFGW